MAAPEAPRGLVMLLAAACGLIVANIYYGQPLAGPIAHALGLPVAAAGLVVTLAQLGYGLGLFFVVPLGDLLENRRLVLVLQAASALALAAAALSRSAGPFLAASFVIGVSSVAVQVLVPYAAHLAPEAQRGRVVGNVMSGLLLGIMLARPVASLVAQLTSWPVVFGASSVLMVSVGVVLARRLPPRAPTTRMRYGELLRSMARLVRTTPVLRRRSLYHACLFGAFSLFWTTAPLLLASPAFGLSQGGIALFALIGVAGAVSAPIAGRVADRGWIRPATGVAMACVAVAFAATLIAPPRGPGSLVTLLAAGVLLDFGVAANITLGQRAIFALGDEVRSRLNAVYMTTFFLGGALGSAAGAWAYAHGGWTWAATLGLALPLAAAAYFATE
ncbi:MAG TPA: MFS transporter [Burkholderiaceae bacterium]|nr:MFS transporter [Burkholderiaceae bacterium]